MKMGHEIITAVITSGLLIGGFELVRDWKSKRKNDTLNNKGLDYKTQKDGLDLVSEFYKKVKELTDVGYGEIKNELFLIKHDIELIKKEQNNEREFLNGKYEEFLKNKENDEKNN